ncbi:hypothetical protein D8674_009387 [Pyrus ussuriensis x Pyrus communis]|uniref:Stress-associated endoplasmic reticulum protein 2-like n=2 Tax=Pyrus TaxID=3766 RepID=A0A5N5F7T1_9ROSA|nr:hypothetical protein D8674_009387 [Pyrus ussuriensis x Pyrus communis]
MIGTRYDTPRGESQNSPQRENSTRKGRSNHLRRTSATGSTPATMTTSRRLADRKVERFEKNITKRGAVPETTAKKSKDYPVGPILLGFFVFVVIGSSLFQIIRTATSGGMA